MPEDEKLELPITNECCPACGSDKRIAEIYIKQLKKEGTLPKGFGSTKNKPTTQGLVFRIPLIDPAHPPMILSTAATVPALEVYYDVCECGVMYCTEFNRIDIPIPMQMQPPGKPPLPPNMIFGQG